MNKGSKHTEEAKKKISIAKMGSTPVNKGEKMSDKQKKKLSIA